MSRSENLPVLPQAASTVLKLADDPDASTRDMERAIERDPAITAKILKVANSAYYGSPKVPTLGRAISFLGLTTVRSLVVSVAMQAMASGKSSSASFSKIEYWRHCLAVGTTARILGKLVAPMKAEELYCAGMMHDIGLLVMEKFMSTELNIAIKKSCETATPLAETERAVCGFTHAEAGALLARHWGLSPLITCGIRYIDDPLADEEYFESTCIVNLAECLANRSGFGHSGIRLPVDVDPAVVQTVGLPEEQYEVVSEVTRQEIARAQEAFRIAA